MELEDIVYELACLHESMLFCCEDRSGKEDPVFAHYCMALGRIVRDLEEAERRIRTETAERRILSIENAPAMNCRGVF
ncbi:hypothetical protein [Collinsella aerofaciens]|uniref:hypothetical protein n=1 Tax=Collinsella aerofaciens TaxID=74426 RepID=UPI00359CA108